MKNLIDILPEHLKEEITPAEERLIEAVQKGNPVDFRSGDKEIDKHENADKWGNERIISSEILYWLCTNLDAIQNIHTKGIRFVGAKITGNIDFEGVSIPHILVVTHCFFDEGISLVDAKTKTINLSGSHIQFFIADRANIEGTLFLKNVITKGGVRLVGANINGNLVCTEASFENGSSDFYADKFKKQDKEATKRLIIELVNPQETPKILESFNADRLMTKNDVFLDNITAKGEVRLIGANINGNLICTGASFENLSGISFNGDKLTTKNDVLLNNIISKGKINLNNANINGDLICDGASFEHAEKYTFNVINTKIDRVFVLNKISKKDGGYNFAYTNAGRLLDDENSWPQQNNLILTGFEYKEFAGSSTPKEAYKRIKWIRLQPKEHFSTQPYIHLVKLYRQIGHESDAKEVLIAKQEDLRKYGKLSIVAWLWNWFLGVIIYHGYKSNQLFLFILLFLLLGVYLFDWANNLKVMQPSKERVYISKEFQEKRSIPPEYPQFNPIIYSIDAFVPFLDLHQEDYWLPDATKTNEKEIFGMSCGSWFRFYFWVHIILGWIFSTLAVVYLTGLIRKE